jgi:hypothetical protein
MNTNIYIFVENHKEKSYLDDLAIEWSIILKWVLKE